MKAKNASRLPKPMPDKAAASGGGRWANGRGDGKVGMNAGHDDGDQTADLNQREQARQHDRFQNAPRRHCSERNDNDHHDQALRKIDELLDISHRSKRNGGG